MTTQTVEAFDFATAIDDARNDDVGVSRQRYALDPNTQAMLRRLKSKTTLVTPEIQAYTGGDNIAAIDANPNVSFVYDASVAGVEVTYFTVETANQDGSKVAALTVG